MDPRPPTPPSAEDLKDIKNLDALLKACFNRAHLFSMQAGTLREEAAALGIGKLAAHSCRVHSVSYYVCGMTPHIFCSEA
jgi:hypothetical protein